MAMTRNHGSSRPLTAKRLADGLGWFSIGLGMAELLAPGLVARGIGMRGKEGLLRFYGMREIATGIGILSARDKTPWIWGRVAGDVLDVGTVAARSRRKAGGSPALGLAMLVGVTAVDVACGNALATEQRQPRTPARDYSDRSGFRRPPHEMRGAARDGKVSGAEGRGNGGWPPGTQAGPASSTTSSPGR